MKNGFTFFTLILGLFFFETARSQSQDKSQDVLGYIKVYQKYISGTRGGSCPMYPSCSVYGYNSFSRKGFLTGLLNTPDRLLRCGHDRSNYQITYVNNKFQLLDPVNPADIEKLSIKKHARLFPVRDSVKKRSIDHELIIDLMSLQFFSEALIVIRRNLLLHKEHKDLEVMINYLRCLVALNREEEAIYYYEQNEPTLKQSGTATLTIAQAWNRLGNWGYEEEYLKKTQQLFSAEQSELSGLKLHLASVYTNQNDIAKAAETLKNIDIQSKNYSSAQKKLSYIEYFKNDKRKKPWVGGVLGLIPGAGYLYANHKQTALSAFLLNGLLMYATYSSVNNENYGVAAVFGLFSLTFYSSGIVGSIEGINRYNKNNYNKFIRSLKTNY